MVKKYGLSRFVNQSYPQASWYAKFIIKQVLKNRLQGSETFGENLHKTFPKLIFILIPFFALLLKLLYVRRKIPYFDHLIFSVHFLSCFFLLLLLSELGSLIADWLTLVVYILLMVYLYFALLRVYHQKKWKTLFKFLLLFFGSFFMLFVFFFIAVSISLLLIWYTGFQDLQDLQGYCHVTYWFSIRGWLIGLFSLSPQRHKDTKTQRFDYLY